MPALRPKVGLLNPAEELGNVSKACQIMGLSRAIRFTAIAAAVIEYAIEYPAHGQVRVSNELRKRGVFVSAANP